MEGFIDHWNGKRGFGFIQSEKGERIFAHATAFKTGTPVQGAFVKFDVGATVKGRCAINIEIVSAPKPLAWNQR